MPYDPDRDAQIGITGNRKTLIQDGIEYKYVPPHDPVDPEKAAKREAELEAERLSKAPLVTLLSNEALTEIGEGFFIAKGPNGMRGPWPRARVAHLLAAPSPAPASPKNAELVAEPLALNEGETIRETKEGSGWFHVLNGAGEPTGPAYPKKRVVHLLGGA